MTYTVIYSCLEKLGRQETRRQKLSLCKQLSLSLREGISYRGILGFGMYVGDAIGDNVSSYQFHRYLTLFYVI